jgi:hypothetical protein
MIKSDDAALQRLPGTVGVVGAAADAQAVEQAKLLLQHLGAFVIAKGGLSAANMQSVIEAAPALQVRRSRPRLKCLPSLVCKLGRLW